MKLSRLSGDIANRKTNFCFGETYWSTIRKRNPLVLNLNLYCSLPSDKMPRCSLFGVFSDQNALLAEIQADSAADQHSQIQMCRLELV